MEMRFTGLIECVRQVVLGYMFLSAPQARPHSVKQVHTSTLTLPITASEAHSVPNSYRRATRNTGVMLVEGAVWFRENPKRSMRCVLVCAKTLPAVDGWSCARSWLLLMSPGIISTFLFQVFDANLHILRLNSLMHSRLLRR